MRYLRLAGIALIAFGATAAASFAAPQDVKVSAQIVRHGDGRGVWVRLRIRNNTQDEIVVTTPFLCSYSYGLIRDGVPVISKSNPPSVSIPTELRDGEVNCGANACADQYLQGSVRLLVPTHQEITYEERLVEDQAQAFIWDHDHINFLFNVPTDAFASIHGGRLRVPLSVSAHFEPPSIVPRTVHEKVRKQH